MGSARGGLENLTVLFFFSSESELSGIMKRLSSLTHTHTHVIHPKIKRVNRTDLRDSNEQCKEEFVSLL